MTVLYLSSSLPRCPLSRRSPRFQFFKSDRRIRNSVGANPNLNPNPKGGSEQNVIVLRHGDRIDNFDPHWVKTAERPWDPPLVHAGCVRAFSTGRQLRLDRLGFRINRIFVSPFLRCIQTASEVATAICATDDDVADETIKVAAACDAIDPSKVMVSVEYGLCEMFNRIAIRPQQVPKDQIFHFDMSELEGLLPVGTIDHTAEQIYKELPRWEETQDDAGARYKHVIQALADKYPTENLLLVTHGEGVVISVASFLNGAVAHQIDYCGYSHAKRRIVFKEHNLHEAGGFEMVTLSGIKYYT
ncbi:hypothetical protein V2J09_015654 [Rumex salicifolius]